MAKKSKYADNTAEFKKRMQSDNVNGIFVFFGEEKYSRDVAVDMIKSKFVGDGLEQFNIAQLGGKNVSTQEIDDFTSAYPMMSDKKILIIRDSEILKRADAKMADFFENLLADFPSYLTVIIDQDTIDSRISLTKKLLAKSLCVEFLYKTPAESSKWCINAFKKQGIEISFDIADYLTASCDPGLYSLKSEIDKLCSKCIDTKIVTREDIDESVKKSVQNRIFEMLDAIILHKNDRVFEMLSDMKILNEAPVKIIALLGSTLIKLYKTAVITENGGGRGQVASQLSLAPFIAEKYISMASHRSIKQIGHMISKCADYDYRIKSGQLADWASAEMLISEILSM